MVENASKKLTLRDSSITFNNFDESLSSAFYVDEMGNIVEAPSSKEYTFDSIDFNNGIYLSTFIGEYRCY